jgi:DNA topoisomerase-3
MAGQIVVTEKSSQAKDVRAAVGSRYGDIFPAEGHLFELLEPEDVVPEWKRWSPILLRPSGLYGTCPAEGGNKAAKLKAIRLALRTAEQVWLATDCDREGQLIGQEILEHYNFRGRVLRVLFTAQDPQTIREAFERANTIEKLRDVWPRLSSDEKKLFDEIARAYLAALMPDFRYRQTTAVLDVRGYEFRASGRQPIDFGWRAAFPDWQPAHEKSDEAQLLPALRDGETAQLQDPKIEDKETRPPPRYNEGTLIDAMQNAWRFVDDEMLRERLKEAKGIGTPATRAEIIGGLKKQSFLITEGNNIVPTEIGLSLFDVLKRADPALVDPGVTAQLECLLDDVVVGKQQMVGAIDAVCDVAQRIIGKLKDGAAAGGLPSLSDAAGNGAAAYPPTLAMKRFADSLIRQKGVKAPPGYKTSISICRKFLSEYAPKRANDEKPGMKEPRSATSAQKGVVIPDDAKVDSAAMRKPGRRTTKQWATFQSLRPKRPSRKRKTKAATAVSTAAQSNPATGTPLRIPFGNKDIALRLGARYRSGGWYAPPGIDLGAFGERGWL